MSNALNGFCVEAAAIVFGTVLTELEPWSSARQVRRVGSITNPRSHISSDQCSVELIST